MTDEKERKKGESYGPSPQGSNQSKQSHGRGPLPIHLQRIREPMVLIRVNNLMGEVHFPFTCRSNL